MAFVNDDAVAIAQQFVAARRSAVALAGFPGALPGSLDDAYRIQDRAIAGLGRPVLGWKVGRVHPPFSDRFGADRLTGPIFSLTEYRDGGSGPDMPVFASGFAAAEAEFLLRIGTAPPPGKTAFTLAEAAELIDAVHVGIEIASSPLPTINDLGPAAIVSDFGNNNGLLIGPAIPDWRVSGLDDWQVVTLIDDIETGRGEARDFPDGAIGSARFLCELMARRRIALQPGQWISSGAVTGVHKARPGQRIEARFGDGLAVSCRLVPAVPA